MIRILKRLSFHSSLFLLALGLVLLPLLRAHKADILHLPINVSDFDLVDIGFDFEVLLFDVLSGRSDA